MQTTFTHLPSREELYRFLNSIRDLASNDLASDFFFIRLAEHMEDDFAIPAEDYDEDDHLPPLLFAKKDHQLVGFAWIGEYCEEYENIEADLGLWDIYLLPTYRNQALGKALYEEALKEHLEELETPIILADVLYDNTIPFFKSLGFESIEVGGLYLKKY